MLNIRLNKAIDRHKSRTLRSLIIFRENFQLRRGTCTYAPWLRHWRGVWRFQEGSCDMRCGTLTLTTTFDSSDVYRTKVYSFQERSFHISEILNGRLWTLITL